MNSIYYGLSIVAIFIIIRWFIANDHIAPGKPTIGLLAMKDHQPTASEKTDDGSHSRPQGRLERKRH